MGLSMSFNWNKPLDWAEHSLFTLKYLRGRTDTWELNVVRYCRVLGRWVFYNTNLLYWVPFVQEVFFLNQDIMYECRKSNFRKEDYEMYILISEIGFLYRYMVSLFLLKVNANNLCGGYIWRRITGYLCIINYFFMAFKSLLSLTDRICNPSPPRWE